MSPLPSSGADPPPQRGRAGSGVKTAAELRDESRYYCLYNTHVLSCARVIGFVGTFLSVAGIVSSLMVFCWLGAGTSVVATLAYLSVVYANRSRQPRYYLPYLVLNGIGFVFNFFYVLFLAVMFFWMPPFWEKEVVLDPAQQRRLLAGGGGKQLRENARIVTGVLLALMLLVEALTLWFQTIVYRAYLYMHEECTCLVIPKGPIFGTEP